MYIHIYVVYIPRNTPHYNIRIVLYNRHAIGLFISQEPFPWQAVGLSVCVCIWLACAVWTTIENICVYTIEYNRRRPARSFHMYTMYILYTVCVRFRRETNKEHIM